MQSTRHALFLLVGVVLVGIVAAGIFVYSGIYNIAADDHHAAPVESMIETLRTRSVASRAKDIEAVLLDDPKRIAAGAIEYAEMCVSCHAAPGITEESEIRQGLYPKPPNLAKLGVRDPREAFWVIKHGVKMSGMPAWGPTHNDETIWNMVAFIKQMPAMPPEDYERLSTAEDGGRHHHGEAGHSEAAEMPGMSMPMPHEERRSGHNDGHSHGIQSHRDQPAQHPTQPNHSGHAKGRKPPSQ